MEKWYFPERVCFYVHRVQNEWLLLTYSGECNSEIKALYFRKRKLMRHSVWGWCVRGLAL
jgi:hypothetical protein